MRQWILKAASPGDYISLPDATSGEYSFMQVAALPHKQVVAGRRASGLPDPLTLHTVQWLEEWTCGRFVEDEREVFVLADPLKVACGN